MVRKYWFLRKWFLEIYFTGKYGCYLYLHRKEKWFILAIDWSKIKLHFCGKSQKLLWRGNIFAVHLGNIVVNIHEIAADATYFYTEKDSF